MKINLAILLVTLGNVASAQVADGPQAGVVRFFLTETSTFTQYTDAPSLATETWLNAHFWRMLVYSPYFDSRLSWYPNGDVYFDLYAIYPNSALVSQHPEWILKDANGNWLYIPWGCSQGTCPQYAGDFSNPAYRQWWIAQAQSLIALGYHGLFIDDVNMDFRVGNGQGNFVAPIDSNTGAPMTLSNWRSYMAAFTAQIRAALPASEIVHNSIWYAGPPGVLGQDAAIVQQVTSADYQNIEFGVNDPGVTGGIGLYSLTAMLAYIDGLHAAGRGAIINGVAADSTGEEYALACYFLISSSADAIGNLTATPANWWSEFNVNLGTPTGARYVWQGLLRRDFSGGMVLANPPASSWITATLPGTFLRSDGVAVNSVTLGPGQGAVLTSIAQ
jgi:hypothetical protein